MTMIHPRFSCVAERSLAAARGNPPVSLIPLVRIPSGLVAGSSARTALPLYSI